MTNFEKSQVCIQCQACCRSLGIHTSYLYSPEIVDFYTARGFLVTEDRGYAFLHIELKCPHLREWGCNRYKTRPIICQEFEGSAEFLAHGGNCQLYKEGDD